MPSASARAASQADLGWAVNEPSAALTDPAFLRLPAATQKAVIRDFSAASASGRANLLQLSTHPGFAELTPVDQAYAIAVQASAPGDASLTRQLGVLSDSLNFRHLDAEARKQVWNRLGALSDTPGARQSILRLAPSAGFLLLTPATRLHLLDALAQNPSNGVHELNVQNLLANVNLRSLDETSALHLIDLLGAATAVDQSFGLALNHLVAEPRFLTSSPEQRVKLLDLLKAMWAEGATVTAMTSLDVLLQRDVGSSPALFDRPLARGGPTVLEQLSRLASSPTIDRRISGNGPLTELVMELANPSRFIDQGDHGTCTVTSMTHLLATRNPGEYARLAVDLVLHGTAKMASGKSLVPPDDAFAAGDGDDRSVSERLMQSAMMRFARGPAGYFNTGAGNDVGLDSDEEAKILGALYDAQFVPAGQTPQLAYQDLAGDLEAGLGPMLVSLRWVPGGHMVDVIQIQNGRVYFRNPWGGGVESNQALDASGPPRRVENEDEAIESISVEDFIRNLKFVLRPTARHAT